MKVLTGILAAIAFATPALGDPFVDLVNGFWTRDHPTSPGECENPKWWEVNPDQNHLTVNSTGTVESRVGSGKSFDYRVISHNHNSITMFLEGETWRDEDGNLVTWKLLIIDKNHYVWIRSDWPIGAATKPLFRCVVSG